MNDAAERETIEPHVAVIRTLIERDQQLVKSGVTISPERHEAHNRSILDHLASIERVLNPPPTCVGIPNAGSINDGRRPNLRIVRTEDLPCP